MALAATILSTTAAWPARAEPPADGPQSTGVDLANPEAGITDPVGGFPVLDRNCKAGQVDVNTATAQEISGRFGLATQPTVQRIIAGRPWLTPGDLVSVPGVPPTLEPRLVSDGCATPLVIPEPAPSACTSNSQVDLQVAPLSKIMESLNLPRVTAEAIIAHRPVPQNLLQIVAPRTPGFDANRVAQLRSKRLVCVTPPPSTFAGTDYRFVYPASGGVVTAFGDARYALIVPPGVVSQPGVIRVTPVTGQDLPTADVHIFGPFAGQVAVRLPDVSEGEPLVFHDAADGLRVSWGEGTLSEPAGTVVSTAKSLSEFSSSDRDLLCGTALRYSMSVTCTNTSPVDELLSAVTAMLATGTAERMNRFTAPNGECIEPLRDLVSEGSTPPGLICSASAEGSSSTWTFENALTSVIVDGLIESFGAVYHNVQSGAATRDTYGSSPGSSPTDGPLSGPAARFLADELGLIVGGHARNYVKNAGDGASSAKSFGARARVHQLAFGLFNIGDILDAAAEVAQIDTPWTLASCADKLSATIDHNAGPGPALQCAKDLADGVLAAAIIKFGDSPAAKKLIVLKAALGKLFVGFAVANYGSSLISRLATGGIWNDQTLTFQHLAPLPPVGGGGGSGGPNDGRDPGSLSLDGTGNFIARVGESGESWLVDQGGNARPILDGNTFACYATRLVVVDYVNTYMIGGKRFLRLNPDAEVVSQPAPACLITPFQTWTYEPTGPGATPVNVILRGQFDGAKYPAWLINSAGQIQSIPLGGDYVCLAFSNPVLWDVPFEKIQAWPNVGTEPAICG